MSSIFNSAYGVSIIKNLAYNPLLINFPQKSRKWTASVHETCYNEHIELTRFFESQQ